jgi:hypothetical protein
VSNVHPFASKFGHAHVVHHTAKTREVDSIRFGEIDLSILGTLDRGQFGAVRTLYLFYDV